MSSARTYNHSSKQGELAVYQTYEREECTSEKRELEKQIFYYFSSLLDGSNVLSWFHIYQPPKKDNPEPRDEAETLGCDNAASAWRLTTRDLLVRDNSLPTRGSTSGRQRGLGRGVSCDIVAPSCGATDYLVEPRSGGPPPPPPILSSPSPPLFSPLATTSSFPHISLWN
ncbi:hypothetical protein Salat_2426700 [Sesamum alatum]|uniref:Uncharacterized protein n=1 Tax=Sesamum alatum TaxID=300844 RepID=A0AAE2CFE9_9LAMI|nr:hypothetical protein Salat_2426700 [Sesamum alatum]